MPHETAGTGRSKQNPSSQSSRADSRSFRQHRVDTRRRNQPYLGPVGQIRSRHQKGVHVVLMAADSGRRRKLNLLAKLRCAKVQPIFPAPQACRAPHHQAAPPNSKSQPFATDGPQRRIYVPASTTNPKYPAAAKRRAARKARKPTTHDCNIARNVIRSRLGRFHNIAGLIPTKQSS